MAIAFTKYVDITSGVGGGSTVRRRDLILRLFTTNTLLATGTTAEFESADEVLAYFGSTSEEYKRAAFYFGFVSKNITAPQKIAFTRWADVATVPMIWGAKAQSLAALNDIVAGSLVLSIGGTSHELTALNFSTAAAYADVATVLEDAIQSQTGGQFTGATVTYSASRGGFNLVAGGPAGAAVISVSEADPSDGTAAAIGWGASAIMSDGAAAQSVATLLADSTEASNNFASFAFIPSLTDDEIDEAAIWNATQNVMFLFLVPASAAKAQDYYDLLASYPGIGVTLSPLASEYPELLPGAILAATAYTRRNSVQNYMFQQAILTPGVTTTADSDTYDAIRVNYYGQTQTAGQNVSFYQRGVLMGTGTAPTDMNIYANEIWLKDAAGAAIMTLLLSLARLSANSTGRSQLLATLQGIVNEAVFNGTVSIGKDLTTTQKLYIDQITGDPVAWQQIQTIGYWLDVVFEQITTEDGRTEYKAVYTLVYSKDDQVRKVEGSHILI